MALEAVITQDYDATEISYLIERGPIVTQIMSCVLSPAVDIVFGRWTGPILWTLRNGTTMRFTELQHALGISPKVLTQRLRQLETDGLITRTYYPEMPPRVEYSGTPLADTLEPVFQALNTWSAQHLGDVLTARVRHHDVEELVPVALPAVARP